MPPQPRILWINDWTVEELLGGAELTGRELVTAGKQLGFNVRELTPRTVASEGDWLILNNIRTFPLYQIQQMLNCRFLYFCHDPLVLPIHQQLFSLAKHIFFYSPAQQDFYLQRFYIDRDKVSICPAPIEAAQFYKNTQEPKEDFAVALTDVAVNKGINNLVEFARKNASLRIELYGKLVDLPEEPLPANLQYKGILPYPEVPQVLARAKYFVHLPNWLECFGRSVAEAYLSGCELKVNQNIGAFSCPLSWNDREELSQQFAQIPQMFWNTVNRVIGG